MATIRSEGGLLPADLLARVAALDRDLGGLAVSDFHLAPNERLGEAIARSWARLTAAWEAFSTNRDELPAGDHAGKPTRERWLLPLFSELGYGRLIQQSGVDIAGKTYAVFCEYNHSPVHLVGAGVPLDRRTPGVRGAADQSPHSVVQELLNRSTERLWGIVTNGLSLRLLRDNVTLTRQAYVEFDLEAIFATEAYEDFALLWLCAHQSRVEAEVPEECWLERWIQAAQRDGTRALGELRSGVERAIETLGRGFLTQPGNTALHEALRDGSLNGLAYYRELLRLVYRLLFLFVAEDRDALLLPEDGTPERFDARERYDTYYATKRLRRLSVRRRGGRAHDLYEQVKLLCGWLHDSGQPVLALPPLGSALWDPATTAHVSGARLGNEHLLEAIRELAHVEGGRRPVDFRNLGAEELGSVYESLLELHPEIDRDTAHFALTTAVGHERKQTGSYYTPTSLIGSLLETALDPVIERAAQAENPERALLDLTVCDPACGSGHFLIAAANRIAKRVAAIREHDPEPAPEAIRHALRDVVSRCVHGVDMNPMAVELCKVSLWLEALEPGRPLSFLDDRILFGNSLLGATPALIEDGIPDAAFKPLLGDDGDVAKAWRQHNARERRGQIALRLGASDPARDSAAIADLAVRQRAMTDDSLAGIRVRAAAYNALLGSDEHSRLRLAADAWFASFMTPKRPGATRLTTSVVQRASQSGPEGLTDEELDEVREAVEQYQPVHWHLAFPAIFAPGGGGEREHGWTAGFDCVLGNPPWDQIQTDPREFFALSAPQIAGATSASARNRLLRELPATDPPLARAYDDEMRRVEGIQHFAHASGSFPYSASGRLNTAPLFTELVTRLGGPGGTAGIVVPTGIATDSFTQQLFRHLVESSRLSALYDFENRERLFPSVDSRARFCLLALRAPGDAVSDPRFAFFLHSVDELTRPDRVFSLSQHQLRSINPNTGTLPILRSRRDADVLARIHDAIPVIKNRTEADGDAWGFTQSLMFMSNTDAAELLDATKIPAGCVLEGNRYVGDAGEFLPLLESKMLGLWDHRAASVVLSASAALRQGQPRYLTDDEHADPRVTAQPRYWVSAREVAKRLDGRWDRKWMFCIKNITSSTNERTAIGAIVPTVGSERSAPILFTSEPLHAVWLASALLSIPVDYIVRNKIGGINLTLGYLEQLPVPPPAMFGSRLDFVDTTMAEFVTPRVLELSYTSHELQPFASDLGFVGPPFAWDQERRRTLRAELDAAMFHFYGFTREEAYEVLNSFPIIKRRDEEACGSYRTRDLTLQVFDDMSETAASRDAGEASASMRS